MAFNYYFYMTYSLDLRKKALDYVESGGSQTQAASIFGVSARTIWNWIQRKKRGKLEAKTYKVPYRKIDNDLLIQYIQECPDAYLWELAEKFDVVPSAIFYACKRLKISLKKRPHIIKKGMKKKGNNFFMS